VIWQEEPRGDFPDPSKFFGLTGVEQMRTFLTLGGPRPPISYLTGMRPTEVGVGSSVFVMPVTKWLLSPQGLLSIGVVALVADASLGCAVQTTLPAATPYTTAELSLNMLRPLTADDVLTARGRIVHGGKSVALSEVFVTDSVGRLIAHGSSRCYILPTFDPAPDPPDDLTPWEEPEYPTPHPYERPADGGVLSHEVWATHSGLEIMKKHLADELPRPPLHYLTGLRPVAAEEGSATFVLPATLWLCPPHGQVLGGAVAMVADAAIAAAVQTTVPAGGGYASLDLKVYFTRPVPADGQDLTAEARVVNRGRKVAVATSEVTNAAGKRVAVASGSVLLVDRPVTARTPVDVSAANLDGS
jgi:uncharacterized protein (TIGR00369 family)